MIFRSLILKHLIGLLDTWQASVIKGNPGELAVLAGSNEVLIMTYFQDPDYLIDSPPRSNQKGSIVWVPDLKILSTL